MTTPPTPQSTPVTLDDVRRALADADPAQTNAGALRQRLGRGSLSTIQRHLEALRAERQPTAQADCDAPPPPPAELVTGVWAAAWAAAQVRTHSALAAELVRGRDLRAALDTARADAAAALARADQVEAAAAAALAHADRERAAAAAAAAQADSALAQARAGLEAERQARALEAAEARAARSALSAEIDRLVQQLADLRAALAARPGL